MDDVIILDDGYKYFWKKEQIEEIKTLYLEGYYASQIASALKESVEDITLVLIHLLFKRQIELQK
ncbi:hypothetical protein [Vagococcus fluvialis]|uniref:hypothetical protein n=1 Tax=Vagococcus fluvialis TaxID=2738 RepID=UPI001D0B7B7E|nr:hypothetical protein [Vagococcus fluvialis]MDT2782869.1 hypothetical protein [Vagococcus fluvialis]UDM70685.1 hypothetical protein K5L00_11215 [Vagococcus fluvialis]UDM78104.1 hypothetical protein K5K98_06750 [Vagococcus fluvialis]UDM82373.1 hypothetical protein K5K96_13690 [Vagococcus fluvialis]